MKPKNSYSFFNEFCLSIPLLTIDFCHKLTKQGEILTQKFKEIWKNKVIKEAIFLALSDFYTLFERWLSTTKRNLKKVQRLQSSLLKYLSRMLFKCAHFELFSGPSIVEFRTFTKIKHNTRQYNPKQTRLSMSFWVIFSQRLSQQEGIKTQLLRYRNYKREHANKVKDSSKQRDKKYRCIKKT